MRNSRLGLVVCLVGVIAVAVVGCGKKGGDAAQKKAGDGVQKKVEFKPGKLVPFTEKTIGFSILKPEAVPLLVKGDTAELKADGFPTVTISLHKTKEISTGSGSSGGMGRHTRKVYAPMRKLVCHCEDMGKHEDLVKQICKSLKNTKDAPKKPTVKFEAPKVEGFPSGKIDSAASAAFVKGLKALEPQIVDCWKKAAAADAKFPQGHLNFQLDYKDDGSVKQSSISRTFNYKGHKPLTSCVEKLVLSVKPKPKAGLAKLGWYLRFKLY